MLTQPHSGWESEKEKKNISKLCSFDSGKATIHPLYGILYTLGLTFFFFFLFVTLERNISVEINWKQNKRKQSPGTRALFLSTFSWHFLLP